MFSFLACERDSMGNLSYWTHEVPRDEPADSLVPVDKFVLKVRAMLREFLRLMFGTQPHDQTLSSYCSEDLCAFTAEQLDIRYCHRMIQYVPVVIRRNLTMEAAQSSLISAWTSELRPGVCPYHPAARQPAGPAQPWAHLQAVTATALTDLAFFPGPKTWPCCRDAAKRYNPEPGP